MNIYGVDISSYQNSDVVEKIASNGKAKFIITRATIGSYTKDKKIDSFMSEIQKAKLKNSYYVASYAKNPIEAEQEADFICDVRDSYNDNIEMPIFFDWEYFSADYIKDKFGVIATPNLVQSMALAFCKRVWLRGYQAGVYLNKDYWDRFYTDKFFAKNPDIYIWYARPGLTKPDKPCYLWQYASEIGKDFGYNGYIDKDILMGKFIEEVQPMKPLCPYPCRMKIGFASSGDIKLLTSKLAGLKIPYTTDNGYIITDYMTEGDQCYIMTDCNKLGIPYKEYTDDNPSTDDNSSKPISPTDGEPNGSNFDEGKPHKDKSNSQEKLPDTTQLNVLLYQIYKKIIEYMKGLINKK